MRFPQTFIDDLERQADIVRIVQDYVDAEENGCELDGCLSVSQREDKPSFSVSPAKEMFLLLRLSQRRFGLSIS